MAIDKKMSQFAEVTALDTTSEVVILQGNPLDNKRIKKDNFIESIGINDLITEDENLQSQITDLDETKMELDGSNSSIGNLQFKTDQTYAVTNTGEFGWNQEDGTINVKMIDGVTLQLGQENLVYALASENISNGDVIQSNGVQGNHLRIKKAVPAEINSIPGLLIGIATENITSGAYGYVTVQGKVNDVYTTGFVAGDLIYYNSNVGATPGTITKTKPASNCAQIILGTVVKAATGGAENGIIYCHVDIRPKISELTNVEITNPLAGDILAYDANGNVINTKTLPGNYIFSGTPSIPNISGNVNVTGKVESNDGFYTGAKDDSTVLLNGGGEATLSTFERNTNKGQANGYASLDSGGKVPTSQLPAYVDDVLEFANLAAFPVTGETGKIYIALDTNKTYRWSGSVYVYITSGAVDSVNGKTGVVVLNPTDIGAAPAVHTHDDRYYTETEADARFVDNISDETVGGIKTFSNSPIVPTPTNDVDAANKGYVTSQVIANIPASTAIMAPEIAYHQRVLADSGSILDLTLLRKWFGEWLRTKANYDRAYIFELGIKERTSGANKFASKFYDLMTGNYDGAQATDATQPYTSINAAPNSRKCLKGVNGESATKELTFTSKSYLSTDSWTITAAVEFNDKSNCTIFLSTTHFIRFYSTGNIILVGAGDILTVSSNAYEAGKTYIFEFQYSNGAGLVKVNGIPVATVAAAYGLTIDRIRFAQSGSFGFRGKLKAFLLSNSRTSEYDSKIIHDTLRAMFPEIEGIGIGNQFWATSNFEGTVDGAGNAIPEVQGATNTERITATADRDFSSDTGWWSKSNAAITITDGVLRYTSAPSNNDCFRNNLVTIGKWYKVTYTVVSITGIIRVVVGASYGANRTTAGTYTEYIQCTSNANFYINCNGVTTADIDNVSLLEVGWDDSTNMYNYFITAGNTVAQASLKASMWCHYNNSTDNGAVYGKLYNWYAAYTLSLNPPKGWRVPTKADIDQIITYLGVTNAGNKSKLNGTTYWQPTNIGATNENGFSAIASGFRDSAGSMLSLGSAFRFWSSTQYDNANGYRYGMDYNTTTISELNPSKMYGFSLRLIKNAPVGADAIEVTTGNFTTNIASGVANKDLTIPFGYTVKEVKVISANNLTNFSCNLYNTSLVLQNNLLSGKVATAGTNVSYMVLADQNVQYTDPILRFNCTGNTTGGMEIKVRLEKNMF